MSYLLDTMIVSYFFQAGREKDLAACASKCGLAMVDEVRVELENATTFGGKAFQSWLAGSGIAVRCLDLGSTPSATLAALINPTSPARGLGERASIALAASDSSLTFVTHDKGAVWIGLRELWEAGERILGVPVFLRWLFEQGAVADLAVLDDVIAQLDQAHRPTWWAGWRAHAKGPTPSS